MGWAPHAFEPLQADDPQVVGGYVLRARLGAGGMGRVFLSFTPGGRAVAVKVVRPELAEDPEFRARFAREIAVAQQVNGIYIAQLIDAGPNAPVPWLASAYVAGPALDEAVAAHGPLPAPAVLALTGHIAESLIAIHAAGIVHRDLKPANVLLDSAGPKVIDFGIVRATMPTATSRTSTRTLIGSPPFMAPEQILGRPVTPAADVFALGATAYFLATGQLAFQAEFTDGVLYRVVHDQPDFDACPESLRGLIESCLQKDPADRPRPQQVIEACGLDRQGLDTTLPPAVTEMIRVREAALAAIAAQPNPSSAVHAAPTMIGTTPPGAGPFPGYPQQLPMPGQMPGSPAPAGKRRRGRTALAVGSGAVVLAALATTVIVISHSPSSNSGNGGNLSAGNTTPASSNRAGSTPIASAEAANLPSPIATTPAPTTPATDAVQWQGQVLLSNNGVDLDAVPVSNNSSDGSSLYDSSPGFGDPASLTSVPVSSPNMAVWMSDQPPTRSQCQNLVTTQAVWQQSVSDGTVLCVVSGGGHVAEIAITDTAANGGIMANVKVWAQTGQ